MLLFAYVFKVSGYFYIQLLLQNDSIKLSEETYLWSLLVTIIRSKQLSMVRKKTWIQFPVLTFQILKKVVETINQVLCQSPIRDSNSSLKFKILTGCSTSEMRRRFLDATSLMNFFLVHNLNLKMVQICLVKNTIAH